GRQEAQRTLASTRRLGLRDSRASMNDAEDDEYARAVEPGEVGLVAPRDYTSNEPFACEHGQELPGFTLRYETYGHLNPAGDNAVLVCHALSGDHHCAGIHSLN